MLHREKEKSKSPYHALSRSSRRGGDEGIAAVVSAIAIVVAGWLVSSSAVASRRWSLRSGLPRTDVGDPCSRFLWLQRVPRADAMVSKSTKKKRQR